MSLLQLRHAVAAVVYVSEGANAGVLGSLRRVAEDAAAQACGRSALASSSSSSSSSPSPTVPGAALLHVFSDPHYNRSSFVLAGASPQAVAATALELTSAALKALPDLREHDATHPRIGIVDHISFAPLCPPGSASSDAGAVLGHGDDSSLYANVGVNMEDAADAAASLSHSLANDLDLPVMMYGAARRAPLEPRTLAETRRQTPYFRSKAKNSGVATDARAAAGAGEGEREGEGEEEEDIWKGVVPDFGGPVVDPRRGVCCCGAVPLVLNYNVRLATSDRAVAAAAAKAVRARRAAPATTTTAAGNGGNGGTTAAAAAAAASGAGAGGGLPFVEALPLVHENGNFEVACNLLDPSVTAPEAVLERIAAVAMDQFGVAVDDHYTIGMTANEIRRLLVEAAPTAAE